jgi:TolB-like protein/DNA-binding winged helix-turn-helix (wHTH) protein/tetratricopeptide (TPR) repeat protein
VIQDANEPGTILFGKFAAVLRTGELLREGLPVRLPAQSFQVLCLLLSRPGQLVSRQELQKALWPNDTFGDFEHGLNAAVNRLREGLGDRAEAPQFVETLPRRGYRFISEIRNPIDAVLVDRMLLDDSVPPAVPAEADGTENPGRYVAAIPVLPVADPAVGPVLSAPVRMKPHSFPSKRKARLILGGSGACVAFVVAAAFGQLLARRWLHRGAPVGITSLAVLPLDNLSGDPSQEYFVDGMTDELITELAHVPGLRVVSRTSAMQEKGTRKPLQQIGRELNVDAIVEGSAVRSGDKVRITAQLIDVRNDKHLWAQSFEGSMNDVLSLQDSATREIVAQTAVALTPAVYVSGNSPRQVDPVAHDAYLRGRYFLDKRAAFESAGYFRQAISIAPNYASAYAGLADALASEYLLRQVKPERVIEEAVAAAKRAIQLDPRNAEAFTALGGIETTYEWNWAIAEQDLRRGIELGPNNAAAEMYYVTYLDAMDRPEEAVQHMRRALNLDPLSFTMNRHMGTALFFARHYDEALYYLRRAREMQPDKLGVVDNWISWIAEKKGLRDEAVSYDLSALQEPSPQRVTGKLRAVFMRSGWKAYWQARIESDKPQAGIFCVPYDIGVSYLRLGDHDQAFTWLNRAVDQRCYWLIWAKVDPLLDDLRTDRRYDDLLGRLNLPR